MSLHADITGIWLATRESVAAYHADRAVEQGYCARCLRRRRDGTSRMCHTCRKLANAESMQRSRDRKKEA